MDCTSVASTVLFEHLCVDLDLYPEPTGSRFDPFPSGIPCESELSVRDFARYALLCSVFKKSEVEEAPSALFDTLASFLEANKACEGIDAGTLSAYDGNPAVGLVLNEARHRLYNAFHVNGEPVATMGSIESHARFGPGRSVGLGAKPSLLYFKVGDSVQTAGSDFVRSWYELSVRHNPLCEAAEMARQARWGRAQHTAYGNLTFVPKSFKKKRIVITEPSLDTYFQLGLGRIFETVLDRVFDINFSTQPTLNSELARRGSVDGEYATADLTQCSDYISLGLVEFLFPPSVVRWIKILRTPIVRINSNTVQHCPEAAEYAGKEVALNMCSTMGNGFTFPLQTLILSSIVQSCLDILGVKGKWGVFGDDIVVPTLAYPLMCEVLHVCGLKVNLEKSYACGFFRESCGTDYFKGVDVRGVYLKDYSTDQDLASAFNRLALWSAIHDIPLTGTLRVLVEVMERVPPVVPPDEAVTAGIRIPMPSCDPDMEGLWRYEAWRPKPSVFTTEPWFSYEIGCSLDGKPKKFIQWVNDLNRLCNGSYNEPALLKVMLAGGIRRYSMVFRSNSKPKYRLQRAVTPRWGFSTEDNFPIEGDVDVFLRLQLIVEEAIAVRWMPRR